MNLKDIRDAIFSQADWAPTQSTDAKDRVDAFINRAYLQMAEEAPFLFFEQTIPFATMPDITASDAVPDTLEVASTDPFVLSRTVAATAGGVAWRTDGYWNGRMIEITRADGTRYRRRIRDVWTEPGGGSPQHRLSLYQPWPNRTDTGLEYRIYNQAYYLPQDVIQVNSVRLYDQNQNWPLQVVGQYEAEMLSLKDMPNRQVTGIPRTIFRDGHFQLEAPTLVPTVAPKAGDEVVDNWVGPDAAGQFEYVYTYIWGYRDGDIVNGTHVQNHNPKHSLIAAQGTPAARPIPRWESAPSPVATGTTTNGGRGLLITTPDLDFMEGFGQNPGGGANVRYQHGGLRKRIYRKRKTLDTATPGSFTHTGAAYPGQFNQERPDAFFLLADIPAYQTTYLDQGLIVPDYRHRLREVHGYQSIRMNPRPDRRYEVEVRCTRRPKILEDDQDVPVIHKDGMTCLLQKSIALLYEAQGDINLADRALGRYQEALFTLTKRYGDLRYPATPLKRRPARASYVLDGLEPFRRWYTLP